MNKNKIVTMMIFFSFAMLCLVTVLQVKFNHKEIYLSAIHYYFIAVFCFSMQLFFTKFFNKANLILFFFIGAIFTGYSKALWDDSQIYNFIPILSYTFGFLTSYFIFTFFNLNSD